MEYLGRMWTSILTGNRGLGGAAGDGDVAILDGDEVVSRCHGHVGELIAFLDLFALNGDLGGPADLGVENARARVCRHHQELSHLALILD